jgi:hypothetical protein
MGSRGTGMSGFLGAGKSPTVVREGLSPGQSGNGVLPFLMAFSCQFFMVYRDIKCREEKYVYVMIWK